MAVPVPLFVMLTRALAETMVESRETSTTDRFEAIMVPDGSLMPMTAVVVLVNGRGGDGGMVGLSSGNHSAPQLVNDMAMIDMRSERIIRASFLWGTGLRLFSGSLTTKMLNHSAKKSIVLSAAPPKYGVRVRLHTLTYPCQFA